MPYYSDYLLSAYDKRFQTVPEYYPPPMKIPPQITSSLKQVDGLAFAQLPKELQGRRNVIPTAAKQRQGRFRSDKSRRYARVRLGPDRLGPLLIRNSPLHLKLPLSRREVTRFLAIIGE